MCLIVAIKSGTLFYGNFFACYPITIYSSAHLIIACWMGRRQWRWPVIFSMFLYFKRYIFKYYGVMLSTQVAHNFVDHP